MKVFKDRNDQPWQIDLPMGAIRRVKAESDGKFDLFEPWKIMPGADKPLQEILWDDLGEFYELLWFIVEPQAAAKKITAADFGEALAADCIILARLAFFDEWRDFFLQLQRPNVAKALEKVTQYQAKLTELVVAKMNDPRLTTIDQRMTAKMESLLSKSFGKSLDSLDLILADTPGENSP